MRSALALCLVGCQAVALDAENKPTSPVAPAPSAQPASPNVPIVPQSSTTPRPTTLVLEDFEGGGVGFAWVAQATDLPSRGALPPAPAVALDRPRGSSRYAARITGRGAAEGSALVGHHHFALSADATLTFWARCGLANPERLIFAITGPQTESFWVAKKADRAWVGKELLVPTAWTQYRLPIADLAPLGPGAPQPMFSDMVAALNFITYPESFDFWIDDIVLECPRGCP